MNKLLLIDELDETENQFILFVKNGSNNPLV
jgi:hypothetical protein